MAKGALSSQLLLDLRMACACRSRNGRTFPLAKPELGIKRTCPECAARFYDLCKMPCECPKCEHSFEPEIMLKSKKRVVEADKPKPAPAPAAEAKEEEAEADEEDSGVEEVSAEGMSKMPAEVDEDGLAVAPGTNDEEETLAEVDGDIETSDEEENDTLVNFDDDDDAEDVAAIVDADLDKIKDDL